MTTYIYFLGCNSYADVKTKYRELAKQLHPDKPTGNQAKFVAMSNEYTLITEHTSFPLANQNSPILNSFIYDMFKQHGNTEATSTNLDPDEINKTRARNYFFTKRATDSTYDVIDGIVAKSKKDKTHKLWVYQEIQKQWDLELDHFKYVTFVLEDTVATANALFKKYKMSKV